MFYLSFLKIVEMENDLIHLIEIMVDGPAKRSNAYTVNLLRAFENLHMPVGMIAKPELLNLPEWVAIAYRKFQNGVMHDADLTFRDFLLRLVSDPFSSGQMVVLGLDTSDMQESPLSFTSKDFVGNRTDVNYEGENRASITVSFLGSNFQTGDHKTAIIRDISLAELTDLNKMFGMNYEKGFRIIDGILCFDGLTSIRVTSHLRQGIGFVIYENECRSQSLAFDNIIAELKKYIKNEKEVAEALAPFIEKYSEEGNYIKATEFKVGKALHEMNAYRLQRIVAGLPAFEESLPSVSVHRE